MRCPVCNRPMLDFDVAYGDDVANVWSCIDFHYTESRTKEMIIQIVGDRNKLVHRIGEPIRWVKVGQLAILIFIEQIKLAFKR